VTLFGALWPPPEWVQRCILVGVLSGSGAALLRGCLAVTANADRISYLVVILFGGFSLYVIPMIMAFSQLKERQRRFVLGDRSANLVALGLAGVLGTNLLFAGGKRGARGFEAAAHERGISSETLLSLVHSGEASRTPLGALLERLAMNEWLQDPTSHFVLAPALADVRIGPLQLTPRETMLAIRRTGAPWTKEYREIGYDIPRDLPHEMPSLPKAEVVRRLLDENESIQLGALVLAARAAR
jgi:hypothetical protein